MVCLSTKKKLIDGGKNIKLTEMFLLDIYSRSEPFHRSW